MTWQRKKLKDIAEEKRTMFEPNESDNCKYIGLEHIAKDELCLVGIGNSSDTISTKKSFDAGDILFGSLRPYFRKVVRPKFAGVCSTDITVIKAKPNTNQGFLRYLISDQKFIDVAHNVSNGSRMPRASWNVLKNTEWNIPDKNTQDKIEPFLSTYDDLIENNTRRIAILEETVRQIYEEWFIKFRFPRHEQVKMFESELGLIPEGWTLGKLGDEVDPVRGKTITRKTITPGNIPVVAGGLQPAYYHNKANAKAPIITVSASGANAGYVNLYHNNIWASDCSFINENTTDFVYFYYVLLKYKQLDITRMQRGSAQPHVYPKDLMRLKIVKAPTQLIESFEEQAKIIFNLINNLQTKNTNLRKTRNLLLQKLISGEVDVSHFPNIENV